jgi:thioredoxin reductase
VRERRGDHCWRGQCRRSSGCISVADSETCSRGDPIGASGGYDVELSDSPNEQSKAITLHTETEVVGLEGNDRLDHVLCRNNKTGVLDARDIRHVFLMTGANPKTGWLAGCLALDEKGFVKTGVDLAPSDLTNAHWPLTRRPYLLEASLPGVFAVGDVRSGNVKRVASAVGEGSIAISMVHKVLQERRDYLAASAAGN